MRGVGKEVNVSDNEMKEVEKIFEVKGDEVREDEKEGGKVLDGGWVGNLRVIEEMEKRGYEIRENDIKGMGENGVEEKRMMGVEKILGVEKKGKSLGDVKLGRSGKGENRKEMGRGIGNSVKKMLKEL